MKLFRSIHSVMLAALVLMASSNFFVGIHHCGSFLKDITFMDQADGCGHSEMPPCHQKLMRSCCKDEVVQHEAQDFKVSTTDITLKFVPTFELVQAPVILAEVIPAFEKSITSFQFYDPPIRVSDVTVDLQVFLI